MILFVCAAHTVTEQWVLEDQLSVHRGPLSLEVICIIQMPLVGLAALNFWSGDLHPGTSMFAQLGRMRTLAEEAGNQSL